MRREQIKQFKKDIMDATEICVFAPCVGVGHSRGVAVYRKIDDWMIKFSGNILKARHRLKHRAHDIPMRQVHQVVTIAHKQGDTKPCEISWLRKSRRRFDRTVGKLNYLPSRR